jgi:hypothetical protein
MDDALFIYRNSSGPRFCDPATQQMRGGTEKVIVYVNGVLCAMDREAKIITIPVSRWKLAEIGWAVFWQRLRANAQPLVRLRLTANAQPPVRLRLRASAQPPVRLRLDPFLNHRRKRFPHVLQKQFPHQQSRRVLKPNGSVLFRKCVIYRVDRAAPNFRSC